MQIGEIGIAKIQFNLRSRGDIPRVLRGLQYIYLNEVLCEQVSLQENEMAPGVDKHNGRRGMDLWRVLVCGVLRLDLNIDYDCLLELVNEHRTLRQMLGHGLFDAKLKYNRQTSIENVELLTPELCESQQLIHWRQYRYNLRQLKCLLQEVENKKRCKSPETQRQAVQAHRAYLEQAQRHLDMIRATLPGLITTTATERLLKLEIEGYCQHAARQIDQITRRVLKGEVIPHQEKVFSIFEPHTEWISKSKAGVPVELGFKTCILEDQYQFILHHCVMERQTDDQVALAMVFETMERFPDLNAYSFDKDSHSPTNQTELPQQLDLVTLPEKGKLSQESCAVKYTEAFTRARRAHSAVESAINSLEVHGLNKCPDHGIDGFKRYVALAIVTRNIHPIARVTFCGSRIWNVKAKPTRNVQGIDRRPEKPSFMT